MIAGHWLGMAGLAGILSLASARRAPAMRASRWSGSPSPTPAFRAATADRYNARMTPRALHDSHRLTVAPMMDWTDRHCRSFHRLLAPRARLYTEMVHANAVVLGDRERLLGFSPHESMKSSTGFIPLRPILSPLSPCRPPRPGSP